MPQYIFSLNTTAIQGASSLSISTQSVDKVTGEIVSVSNILKPGVLVSSLGNDIIPDSTSITKVTESSNSIKVDLSCQLQKSIQSGEDILFNIFINRVKKGKIGLDKRPVPSISDYQQLADIVTGDTLIDENLNPLVSLTKVPVRSLAGADKSTSAVLGTGVVKIREVFPETSEVSTSLLGVPKSESQLGLFSDVSVLGYDDDTWEYKTVRRPGSLDEWERRKTLSNDDHYPSAFREAPIQQALELTCFPPPYKYPWPPPNNLALPTEFGKFKTFIELGNNLYDYFEDKPQYGPGFANNFLDKSKVKIGPITFKDINGNNTNRSYKDQIIINGVPRDEGFLLIDIWTNTFIDINANALIDITTGLPFTTQQLRDLTDEYGPGDDPFGDSQPGYIHPVEHEYQNEVLLQSKRAFRYQPGRISGFTFGIKASSDSGSENNIVEWGTHNPTDQYLFQIRGASINIVRRSTIPLPQEVIETYGLTKNDQTSTTFTDPTTGLVRDLYELVIPRNLWNVDSLDGNGPSKYLLTSKQVTMYKIEFSWYGAIGANFYAYIPVGNGECRWVLVNRLIIENKMGKVCLEDPFFKFRYFIKIREAKNLKYPQFLYKYGASYYIDGGDEGSNTQASITGAVKNTDDVNRSILVGVHPKESIQNEQGFKKANKKVIIPTSLTVTSTNDLAKVDIVTCRACPGFGYTYDQGLTAKDTLSNKITFYYDNLESAPRIRTKYLYPLLGINYSTEAVTITAENLPYKFKQDAIFKFEDVSTAQDFGDLTDPVYKIDNIDINENNTLTFDVSSSTGVFPPSPVPKLSSLEIKLYNQLFTVDNHLNKIFVDGLYGIYTDMQTITSASDKNEISVGTVNGKEYYKACNLYKLRIPYIKEKINQQSQVKGLSSTEFNWNNNDSQNAAISGGLGLFENDTSRIKIINHDYYTDKGGKIVYYPREAVVSSLNNAVAASDHPIYGINTDIQFLIPHTVRYDSTHVADFLIGVTTKKPALIDGEIKFDYNGTYKDLEDRDYLFIEYMPDGVHMPQNFDAFEVVYDYNERLIIDREIPAINYSDGGGRCSRISITLPDTMNIENCNYKLGSELNNLYGGTLPGVVPENNYILTTDNKLNGLQMDFIGGEVGINGSPTGTKFTSSPTKFTSVGVEYYYIGVTAPTIYTNFTLNLSFIRLTYPTGDGILHKKIQYVGPNYKDKIFDFNPYPLYLVIKMYDRSKINSITIKESFGNTQQVTSPYWLVNSGVVIDTVGGKAKNNTQLNTYFPENFVSKNRLDASSYDTQGNRRLRESITATKASYYVGQGETKKIDLDSVFGLSKTIVTQDIYGLDAIFVTGQNENLANNQMQVTLNISEQ